MNDERPEIITHPITSDGMCGYDDRQQFWVYWREPHGSLTGTLMADLRQHKCLLCTKGWETTATALRDQYFSRETEQHVHKSCYIRYLNFREHARLRDLFGKSGLYDHIEKIVPKPNQYGGAWNTDWFDVHLKFPMKPFIEFGARKRVDAITINRLSTPQRDAIWGKLGEENTTKEHSSDSFMIHAHSHEDVVRYLSTFLGVLSNTPAPVPVTA